MKKFLIRVSLLLSVVLVLTGCGQKASGKNLLAGKELTQILSEVYEKAPELEMLLMDPYAPSAEEFQYYIGTDEIDGIKEMVVSEPMVNIVPYSLVLVRVESGTDVASISKRLEDHADPRKWICVQAEKVAVASAEDVVLLVMADEATADSMIRAFQEVAGN